MTFQTEIQFFVSYQFCNVPLKPSFGTGHIKTPEGKDPVVLMETTRLSLVAEEEERDKGQGVMGMTELGESIRFSGVGSDTEGKK